jgi:ribosomal protein L29
MAKDKEIRAKIEPEIEKEIATLKRDIEELERELFTLRTMLSYYQSPKKEGH